MGRRDKESARWADGPFVGGPLPQQHPAITTTYTAGGDQDLLPRKQVGPAVSKIARSCVSIAIFADEERQNGLGKATVS